MKKISISFLIFFLVISGSGCLINTSKAESERNNDANYTERSKGNNVIPITNFPPSISCRMSAVYPRIKVIEQYGEPQETKKRNEYIYDIWNMEDGSKIFFLYYESDYGAILEDIWQFKNILTNEMFENLTENKSDYNEVLKIDPYSFLCATNKSTAFSEHRVGDGEIVRVEYIDIDDRWVVKNITYHISDPYNFYSIINSENEMK